MNWMVLKAPSWQRLRAILFAAIVSAFTSTKYALIKARRRWQTRGFKSWLFGTIAWAIFIVFYGLIVGFAAALFPPMVSLALAVLTVPFLLWSLPDVRTAYMSTLRVAFFVTVAVYLCFPTYYMVQIPGLPWLSIRRIVIFFLIALTLYTLSTAKAEREAISKTLSGQPTLRLFIFGFFFMAALSILFSSQPATSLSHLTEVTLNWYVPFFSCLMVIRSDTQADGLFKMIAIMSLYLAALGVVDFVLEKNLAVELIPKSMLLTMMENNPAFADMVNLSPYRNGMYRADSIYNTPLSFGEFGAMAGPIGVYYIIYGKRWPETILGCAVLLGAIITVLASGSRGGSLGLVLTVPMFIGLWTIRYTRNNPLSMVGPVSLSLAGLGAAATAALVFMWPKLHNVVLGGGEAQASTDSRFEQGVLAMEQIRANPVTGHGLGRSGELIGWSSAAGQGSVDSYLLTVVVDTGIPGVIFYFGMIGIAAFTLIKIYLTDKDPRAEIAAPLGCSLVAYGLYRFFLSQTENQTLFYIFLALTFVVANASNSRMAAARRSNG